LFKLHSSGEDLHTFDDRIKVNAQTHSIARMRNVAIMTEHYST